MDNVDIASELGNDLGRFNADELHELAIQQADPEVATNALCELEDRDVTSARGAALKILTRPSWDIWLEAYALLALCRLDVKACISVMDDILTPATDAELLQAMVLNVESEFQIFSAGAAHTFALRLAEEVRRRDVSLFDHADEVAAFLQRFSAKA